MRSRHHTVALAAFLLAHPVLTMLPAHAGGEPAVYTLADALGEQHDLSLLRSPATPPRRTGVVSSADPNEGTFHRGNVTWDDGVERILFQLDGPGVITRIWTDSPAGELRFRWDGNDKPQWAVPWQELARGNAPPFEYPFIDTGDIDTTMTFPLPFERGMKISVTPEHAGAWEIHYQYFDPETRVGSWWPIMGPSPEIAAQFTAAENALLEPEAAKTGELLDTIDLLVDPGGGTTWSPEEPILITSLEVFQITGDTPPRELNLFIRSSEGDVTRAPWGMLTGGIHDRKGTAGILSGRKGRTSWLRVPFLLEPGDELGFSWDGDTDGDYVGRLKVWGEKPAPEADQHPRLVLASQTGKPTANGTMEIALPDGEGRLLYVGASAKGGADPWYLNTVTQMRIDSEPILRFGGLGGLFNVPGVFGPADRRSPLSTAILEKDNTRSRFTGALTFWPLGIAHENSFSQTLDTGRQSDMGNADISLVLLGQKFGTPQGELDALPPDITPRPWDHGRQKVVGGGGDRLPRLESKRVPLIPQIHPTIGWLEDGEEISGELDLGMEGDDVLWATIHLDLPHRWKGELTHRGETVEVRELGWPHLRLENPTDELEAITWRIIPPDDAEWGTYITTARIVTRYTGDYHHEIKRPIEIHVAPRIDPALTTTDFDQTAPNEWAARIPDGFSGRPGDLVVAEFSSDAVGILHGELTFHPFVDDANMMGRSPEVESRTPPDGVSRGRLLARGGTTSLTFPVGRHASWITEPTEFRVTLFGDPDQFKLESIKIYRRSHLANQEGWSRQVPYAEWPESHFRVPQYRTMIRGEELRRSIRQVSAFPGDFIDSIIVDTEFLENVEEGPLNWRLSNPPRRTTGFRPRIDVTRFFTEHSGSRIAIEHPSINGAQHFAIQFAYGPWSGRVGLRDAQGRLIAWRDLTMERTVNLPHYTWFATKVPSTAPVIYLEAMGTAPGGESQHIMIERFMVLNEEPE
ncbi:MAG: hypothetical protein JJU11_03320 [Candidatus Sumerlaeia bacterium]|nr:hypothetical protein [Candidatus Sumerlaeia bacterium]